MLPKIWQQLRGGRHGNGGGLRSKAAERLVLRWTLMFVPQFAARRWSGWLSRDALVPHLLRVCCAPVALVVPLRFPIGSPLTACVFDRDLYRIAARLRLRFPSGSLPVPAYFVQLVESCGHLVADLLRLWFPSGSLSVPR